MDRYTTNNKISPTQVITIYNDRQKSVYYLEHRHVKSQGGKLTLQAPVPMGEDVFRNIAATFMKTKAAVLRFDGLIPEHILYGYNELGKTVVIWYRPAAKRTLNFSKSVISDFTEATVAVPATLYININDGLYIFALMDDKRPTLSTKLYAAPFFNIYHDGRVCLGSARVGKRTSTFEGEAERFERALYLAEQNGGQSSTNCKTPLNKLWPAVLKSKKAFPSKAELQQHGTYKTLGALIDKLAGKKSQHGNNN